MDLLLSLPFFLLEVAQLRLDLREFTLVLEVLFGDLLSAVLQLHHLAL